MKDKRRFTRTPFDGEAHLTAQGTLFNVEVLDLALKGVLITMPPGVTMTPGETCQLDLLLEDSDIRIPLAAEVRRVERDMAGLEFTRIDLDALRHLRRLLALHLGQDEMLSPDEEEE
ncbi:PilZ domain-containing protein [Alcanivorax quisquiliarum]|uniref:Cyclic diguanosine monophosphate-binding protein n=1 Tax=Alcanivorax quisquiliarum TaxID=2933565 RepID=A0ABT0E6P0_9GAMM|nr:PilZ domain-containing protein [Alcanivorax quisquiliarum]MCK0537476.1 PilZ domain-containing protein [Alcanivorax quisquiliarum]